MPMGPARPDSPAATPAPGRSPGPRTRRPSAVRVALAALTLAVAAALFARNVEHARRMSVALADSASLRVRALRPSPDGRLLAELEVSNRTAFALAWMPFGELDTDPFTNRAAVWILGLTNLWRLPPHGTRTLRMPIQPLPVPWRVSLYQRPWRGTIRERLDEFRERARAAGLPLAPSSSFVGIPSPWIQPEPAAPSPNPTPAPDPATP